MSPAAIWCRQPVGGCRETNVSRCTLLGLLHQTACRWLSVTDDGIFGGSRLEPLLGDGRRLSLASLKTYRFRDLDLLTLSACDTALGGGQNENGREIEGFGALAQTRGANSVIATLWPVADQSTAQFMRLFYRSRAVGSLLTKAQALQQAQVALINGRMDPGPLPSPSSIASASGERQASRPAPSGTTAPAPIDPARPYSHPYFWAPFLLMGNWL